MARSGRWRIRVANVRASCGPLNIFQFPAMSTAAILGDRLSAVRSLFRHERAEEDASFDFPLPWGLDESTRYEAHYETYICTYMGQEI